MPIEYHFDHLDPASFQRLINSLLTERFGEAIRVLPLRGKDGGRDAETVSWAMQVAAQTAGRALPNGHVLGAGRYLFQVKHHRTMDKPTAQVRAAVLSDFHDEFYHNILPQSRTQTVDFFFLITNVPSSREAVARVDEKRKEFLRHADSIHTEILWQEHLVSWLDHSPKVWHAFPELFAGHRVPTLGSVAVESSANGPRSVRLALQQQFVRDGFVRFRQTNLEQRLSRLFVDLDIGFERFHDAPGPARESDLAPLSLHYTYYGSRPTLKLSGLSALSNESSEDFRRVILEGGPGQGKSTVTQMIAQMYRANILGSTNEFASPKRTVSKSRLPIRLELRLFAEWLSETDGSVEQYIVDLFAKDAGGSGLTVESLQSVVQGSPVILIFDGLDEVGSDDLRDLVVQRIMECITRFDTLPCDLRVIVTSRPPAIAGRAQQLKGFDRCQLLSLSRDKIDEYVERWTDAQCTDLTDRDRVMTSFGKRISEPHVNALSKNPMQLSVLLHLIRLKGEAFPDRRAELYKEYFKTVIDRDVEKSSGLRQHRDDIEALHEVIGFEIHSRAEGENARSSLSYVDLIGVVQRWLEEQGGRKKTASELFRLGQERLGLVVALKGEGGDTRYGFEIQPVREYFAAAFINDKCHADAHELFQAMVKRPFWREVALFLAGLRRANEKADLLIRARALDEDLTDGWKQEGRNIVLLLLLEGVLTTPGHVFRESVDFLLDSIDPRDRTPRNIPQELGKLLPEFLKECASPLHVQRIHSFLEAARECVDARALRRLYEVANRLLPEVALARHLREYSEALPKFASRVKLLWPSKAGLDVRKLVLGENLIPPQPTIEWAGMWVKSVLAGADLTDHPHAQEYHRLFLEHIAFHAVLDGHPFRDLPSAIGDKPLAAWAFCWNLKQLQRVFAPHEKRSHNEPCLEASLGNLPSKLALVMSDLVSTSGGAILELSSAHRVGRRSRAFLDAIAAHLEQDGLPGWLACRCAMSIMDLVENVNYVMGPDGRLTRNVSSSARALASHSSWISLRRLLTPFFREVIGEDLDRGGKTRARKLVEQGLTSVCPSHMRVEGSWVSVPSLLREYWLGTASLDPGCLSRVPIPHCWTKNMLPKDQDELTIVLAALGRSRLTVRGPRSLKNRHEVKRLLKAARGSAEPAVLSGALFALLGSPFLEVSELELSLRMLEADAEFGGLAHELFEPHQHRLTNLFVPTVTLAAAVVERKCSVSESTGMAAARFLAQRQRSSVSPLPKLGPLIR